MKPTKLFTLRAVWILMPITAGSVFADALHPWSFAPSLTAAVLAWTAWAGALLALLVPRPVSLTTARFVLPTAFVATVIAASTGRAPLAGNIAGCGLTAIACALGTRGTYAKECAQGSAYGDEDRFPLKVPPALFIGILPTALAVVAGTVVVGPLLLADRRWLPGVIVVAIGIPLSVLIIRLVHQLARRWIVLVPAGLVITDPLTLADPVLFRRAEIMGLGPADPARRAPEQACDLRLGAAFGSCALLLGEDTTLLRRVRGGAAATDTNLVLVTPTAAPVLMERARSRRINVRND